MCLAALSLIYPYQLFALLYYFRIFNHFLLLIIVPFGWIFSFILNQSSAQLGSPLITYCHDFGDQADKAKKAPPRRIPKRHILLNSKTKQRISPHAHSILILRHRLRHTFLETRPVRTRPGSRGRVLRRYPFMAARYDTLDDVAQLLFSHKQNFTVCSYRVC